MKTLKKIFTIFILIITMSMLFSPLIFASTGTHYGDEKNPETVVSDSTNEPVETSDTTTGVYTREGVNKIFGFDNIKVDTDAGNSAMMSKVLTGFNMVMNIIANLFPLLLIAQFIIDIPFIIFPFIQHIVLTYVPLPINSQEAYKVTGTQFTKTNNNSNNGMGSGMGGGMGGGMAAGNQAVTGNQGEQSTQNGHQKNIMTMFIGLRLKTVFIAMVFFVIVRIGLLSDVMVFISLKIITPIANYVN